MELGKTVPQIFPRHTEEILTGHIDAGHQRVEFQRFKDIRRHGEAIEGAWNKQRGFKEVHIGVIALYSPESEV